MGTGRTRSIGAGVLVLLCVLALTAGCAGAQFRYVSNTDDHVFFKVPTAWHEIDSGAVDEGFGLTANPDSATAAIQHALSWSAAYDSDAEPMPEHLTRVVTSPSPALYATVRHLVPSEQASISFDTMRDYFLPVTKGARDQAEATDFALTGFELLYDEVLTTEDGLHGIRIVYNYEFPTGMLHTFDETAYATADSSVLYFLLIRCTARCYRERSVELDDLATSFTVRSTA